MSSEVTFSNLSKEQIEALMAVVKLMGGETGPIAFDAHVDTKPWAFEASKVLSVDLSISDTEKRLREVERNVAHLMRKDAQREIQEFEIAIQPCGEYAVKDGIVRPEWNNHMLPLKLTMPALRNNKEVREQCEQLRQMNHCLAVARMIGMRFNEKRGCCFVPIIDKGSLRSVISIGRCSPFYFADNADCELFIRSVGQDRLNVVFGIQPK